MAGIRLPPEDIDISQARALSTADLISDDDRSIAADSWSIKSDYGSTLDDDQRHADASEALAAARFCAASDYSSDKEEADAETFTFTSMLGYQSYWDATYADELTNFREHGDAGEVWFGADVMEMVASWTKGLCIDISQRQLQNQHNDLGDDSVSESVSQDLAGWSVVDVGTGNGLLLQELAKHGFSDLTGTDYSEGAINLARSLANRDGFTGIKLLVDDVLETKLDKKFDLVMDKGTLDAIGLHQDGPIKRIMYWESMSRLVAPGGLLVITSSNNTGEHKIYIWDRAGHLVKILEGPKEALMDLAWHPVHPMVVSVSLTGLVYIWAKDYTENWSAFAPDFKELEENEEYVEREDEFDLMPETEKVKDLEMNEDDEVDITTVEKDSAFSDSDLSQEELRFLPADPFPDVSEQQEKHTASNSKLGDSKNSDSPLSEETGAMNHDSSQIEGMENSGGEDGGMTYLKRRRKPSEKVLELQAQKVRKPLPKAKGGLGKSSKTKSRIGNGIGIEQEQDMNNFGDEFGIDD